MSIYTIDSDEIRVRTSNSSGTSLKDASAIVGDQGIWLHKHGFALILLHQYVGTHTGLG